MADETIKTENRENGESLGSSDQGKTFYESIPLAVAAPKVWRMPKSQLESIVSFAENILWFLFGMAETLLFARTLLIWVGANGDNLFTFSIYALSYPFVYMINPEAQQVPIKTGEIIPETISIMLVYFIIGYVTFKLLSVLKNTR